jgi:hypothetical protein
LLNQPISISVEVVSAEAVDLMQNVVAPDTARPDTPSPDTIPGKLAPLAIGLRRPDDAAEDAAASAAGANTSRSGELPTVQDKPGSPKVTRIPEGVLDQQKIKQIGHKRTEETRALVSKRERQNEPADQPFKRPEDSQPAAATPKILQNRTRERPQVASRAPVVSPET